MFLTPMREQGFVGWLAHPGEFRAGGVEAGRSGASLRPSQGDASAL
jgi:hypothetical protein